MSTRHGLQATAVSPRTAFFSITALVLVMAGAVSLVKLGSDRGLTPAESHAKRPHAAQGQAMQSVSARAPEDYAIIVKRNLFQATLTKTPPQLLLPPPAPTKIAPVFPFVKTTPGNQASGASATTLRLAYTGMVETPAGRYVLLEAVDTKEAQYVPIGGMAFGCRVVEATNDAVTLDQDGNAVVLSLGTNKVEDVGLVATPPKTDTPNGPGGPPGAMNQPTGGPSANGADNTAGSRPRFRRSSQ
ncbi:MAG TPA: hypothetical protein VGL77_19690 [Armatimonadota bacterium]|jgi:hypothetical protein